MDTIGGSSGRTFTFLPIIYEDDFASIGDRNPEAGGESDGTRYVVAITILQSRPDVSSTTQAYWDGARRRHWRVPAGDTQRSVARSYNISQATISRLSA